MDAFLQEGGLNEHIANQKKLEKAAENEEILLEEEEQHDVEADDQMAGYAKI